MLYIGMAAGIFALDFFIKKYVDRTYKCKERHVRLHNKVYIEKYYNKGAMLNLLAKHPKIMKVLHTILVLPIGIWFYFTLQIDGEAVRKAGLAFLLGGGLNNLFDRYTKGHVVDYIRFRFGPKWLRRIIFNISDFFVFIGAVLTVIGGEVR